MRDRAGTLRDGRQLGVARFGYGRVLTAIGLGLGCDGGAGLAVGIKGIEDARHGWSPFGGSEGGGQDARPGGWRLFFLLGCDTDGDVSIERYDVDLGVETAAVLVSPGRSDAGPERFVAFPTDVIGRYGWGLFDWVADSFVVVILILLRFVLPTATFAA